MKWRAKHFLGARLVLLALFVTAAGSWSARSHAAPCQKKKDHDLCEKVSDATGLFTKDVSKFYQWLRTNKKIGKFAPTPLPGGDPDCQVWVAPIIGSHDTPPSSETDQAHNYAVGVISNPEGCSVPKFNLKAGAMALWIVRFEYSGGTLPPHGTAIGKSWIVGLGTGLGGFGDSDVSGDDTWLFTHCESNHDSTDDAVLFYTHKELCKTVGTELNHDAHLVADRLYAELKSPGAKAAGDDDPALWFRCGGDCCYSDSFK